MTTAYLATKGCYSDFTVVRVFLDKALAKQFEADGFCDDIEEHEITEERVVPGRLLILQWTSAHDTQKGRVPADNWERYERVEAAEHPACSHSVEKQQASHYFGERVFVTVKGLDHVRVRKVYGEQVAMARVELGELDPAGAE